jgi:hypothetical protein
MPPGSALSQLALRYSTSYAMAVVAVLCAVLFALDGGPPPIPPAPRDSPIDCHNVFHVSAVTNNSRITLTVALGAFHEFDERAALRLLHVITTTGALVADYGWAHFWDVERRGPNLTFAILHGVAGEHRLLLACHAHAVAELSARTAAVDIYPPGFTRAWALPPSAGQLADFCLANGTLQLFLQPAVLPGALAAAWDHALPYAAFQGSAAAFAALLPPAALFHAPVLFVSSGARTAAEQLVDVVLPLWAALAQTPARAAARVCLTRNQLHLMKNIERIVPGAPLLNDTLACFAEGHILRAAGAAALDALPRSMTHEEAIAEQLLWTMQWRPEWVAALRARFTERTMVSGRVVVEAGSAGLIQYLRQIVPAASVEVLPTTDDLGVVADCLAQAALFIGTSVFSMVFCMFMSPGAGLLEIQPAGFKCTAFGNSWAKLAGVKYQPLRTGECDYCDHTNLPCYLTNGTQYDPITLAELYQAMERLGPLDIKP